jgi:hypothetical protein
MPQILGHLLFPTQIPKARLRGKHAHRQLLAGVVQATQELGDVAGSHELPLNSAVFSQARLPEFKNIL